MIDLHAHILPGVDDGPPTADVAISMLKIAARDGIRTVVATPHSRWEGRFLAASTILEMTDQIRQQVLDEKIPIEILPGAEVAIEEDTFLAARDGSLMTLANNGKYLLLEFPPHQVPAYADQIVSQLLANGFVPVIAHPERNDYLRRRLHLLRRWMARGALSQITGYSISGRFGQEIRDAARKMLVEGLATVIASDGHSPHRRPVALSEAVLAAEKWVGQKKALEMVTDLPKIILEGGIVCIPVGPGSDPPGPKSLWQRLFGPRG